MVPKDGTNGSVMISVLYCISIAYLVIINSYSVYAYIDPGTGGIIVSSLWQWLVAFLAIAGAVFVRIFIHPIKKFFKWIFHGSSHGKKQIVKVRGTDNVKEISKK